MVLATYCLALFIAAIDTTIVNVDQPSLQRALHASVTDLQWATDVASPVRPSFFGVDR